MLFHIKTRVCLKCFDITLHSFVVSLDIAAMINILQEIIKILLEKMLKAINLYRFHKDSLVRNNSLNDSSSEP